MYKQEIEDLKAELSRADFLVKVKFKFLILVVVNFHHLGLQIIVLMNKTAIAPCRHVS